MIGDPNDGYWDTCDMCGGTGHDEIGNTCLHCGGSRQKWVEPPDYEEDDERYW